MSFWVGLSQGFSENIERRATERENEKDREENRKELAARIRADRNNTVLPIVMRERAALQEAALQTAEQMKYLRSVGVSDVSIVGLQNSGQIDVAVDTISRAQSQGKLTPDYITSMDETLRTSIEDQLGGNFDRYVSAAAVIMANPRLGTPDGDVVGNIMGLSALTDPEVDAFGVGTDMLAQAATLYDGLYEVEGTSVQPVGINFSNAFGPSASEISEARNQAVRLTAELTGSSQDIITSPTGEIRYNYQSNPEEADFAQRLFSDLISRQSQAGTTTSLQSDITALSSALTAKLPPRINGEQRRPDINEIAQYYEDFRQSGGFDVPTVNIPTAAPAIPVAAAPVTTPVTTPTTSMADDEESDVGASNYLEILDANYIGK